MNNPRESPDAIGGPNHKADSTRSWCIDASVSELKAALQATANQGEKADIIRETLALKISEETYRASTRSEFRTITFWAVIVGIIVAVLAWRFPQSSSVAPTTIFPTVPPSPSAHQVIQSDSPPLLTAPLPSVSPSPHKAPTAIQQKTSPSPTSTP